MAEKENHQNDVPAKLRPEWREHEDKTSVFEREDRKKSFPVSHVNIRSSIVFLVAKLLVLDLIATLLALVFFGVIAIDAIPSETKILLVSNNVGYFVVLATVKIILTFYLILQWLNEYYEITANEIIYRRGIIWRKEDVYDFMHIRSIGIHQSFLGRIFNFGTLDVFDRGVYKYYYLRFIHNPRRYFELLHTLVPDADVEKNVFREHLRDKSVE
jgi:membrane protein YdbS with pleckstrin-like domain